MNGPVYSWTCSDVRRWLEDNQFGWYADLFEFDHRIDGEALLSLTEMDLRSAPMNIQVVGDIKRLINAINRLNISRRQSDILDKVTKDHYSIPPTRPTDCSIQTQVTCGSDNLPAEPFKTFLSFIYVMIVFGITSFVMVIVHERVPDMQKYPPLPDIFLDNMPYVPWAFQCCEVIAVVLSVIWCLILCFHKHRWILLRRLFSLTGTVFMLRCFCMLITSLSVPGMHLNCEPINRDEDLWVKLKKAVIIWKGFGMAIQGVRSCGDYMFSGHTVIVTMLNFFITEYTPHSIFYPLHITTWVLNMFAIFFILAAHEHYSIDVFIAFYITSRLFLYYHALANHTSIIIADRERTKIWFPLFSFFESKCKGVVPNQFDLPFSIPSILSVYINKFNNKDD